MVSHFISLQRKSFFRSASFASSLVIKIFMAFGALSCIGIFALVGLFFYKIIKEKLQLDPLEILNRFLIYWFIGDLLFKYALQQMPIINIKPLLLLPFKKNKIISFAFSKTLFSVFNSIHAFFFIPFSITLIYNGYPWQNVLVWHLGLIALVYANNFLNMLLNNKDSLVYIIGSIIAILGGLHYFEYFDITSYTAPFFQGLYDNPFLVLVPFLVLLGLVFFAFKMFAKSLYLDAELAGKQKDITTENLDWLNRFGKTATFLKNDIKLIKRNKRSRSTVLVSTMFLFYGLLFFAGGLEVYEGPVWKIFAGIFVSGGFLLSFGQFVPSWDSAYYPLMMSQNIRYREYLSSKWWLMVIATLISTIIASGYLYFGWDVYLAIIVGAIYNMGVNSHLVLWAGAYVKTPIDLTSNKKAFGDKQAFNMKTILLSLPKMVLPMAIYAIGHFIFNPNTGYVMVAIAGIAGFAFRNMVFNKIEKIYRTEKYKTIWAYKQKK